MSKKDKKKRETETRVENKTDKKTGAKAKEKKKIPDGSVQKYMNVKAIRGGIIETKDGRYVKILEIEPINFALRSQEEQVGVIYSFASWLKIAPVKLQIKSITKKADSGKHVKQIREEIQNEPIEACREVAEGYIRLVEEVGRQEAVTRRFFLIFEYEAPRRTAAGKFEEIYQQMKTVELNARKFFLQCGNEIVTPRDEDLQQAEILYTFYNRRSSLDEDFDSRMFRIVRDTQLVNGGYLTDEQFDKIPISSFVAPRGLNFSRRDCVVMDGLFYTYLYIKSNGFPPRVMGGWVSDIVNAGDGVDVDLFLEKEDRSHAIGRVSQKIRLNRSKLNSSQDTSSDYESIENTIMAGYYIKNGIANNNEDLYFMTVIITISASNYDDLMWRKQQMVNMLKSQDISVSSAMFEQEDCFSSVQPLCSLSSHIKKKAKRNVLTTGAAGTYPFTSFELSDDTGVLLGVNRLNNSLCIVDLFDSKKNKNANLNIIGTSGAGKTFTMQLLAQRMRMRGIQCFIVAPEKGHEFKRACDAIGGEYIKISPGSQSCINVMDIRKTQSPEIDLLDGIDYNEQDSLLAKKVQQLGIFFTLLVPDITNEEEQLVDEALMRTYKRFGITNDNDSLIDKDGNFRTMPTLGDLHEELSKVPEAKRICIILSRFVTGSAASFNRQTNVNLDNKYVVLDLSELKGRLLPVGMMIALDYVWDKIKEDRTKKKAVFIDEIWKLIGAGSNKQAAEFCLNIFKTIRGYGGAAIAATQDLSDFFGLEDGKYGRAIINNSKNKIILNLEHDEAKQVQDVMKLSPSEIRQIEHFERGEALVNSNNNKVPVVVKASPEEEALITTDRAELAAIAEKKRRDTEVNRTHEINEEVTN